MSKPVIEINNSVTPYTELPKEVSLAGGNSLMILVGSNLVKAAIVIRRKQISFIKVIVPENVAYDSVLRVLR